MKNHSSEDMNFLHFIRNVNNIEKISVSGNLKISIALLSCQMFFTIQDLVIQLHKMSFDGDKDH